MKTTVTANELIEKINNFLAKTNQKLPSRGILAGQSLATVYMELVGFNKYKTKKHQFHINDVDVFVQTKNETGKNLMLKEGAVKLGYIGNYGRFLDVYAPDKYKVVSTRHIKNLNVTYYNNLSGDLTPIELISLFDINCTQIAIDLTTKELYLSENFKEFLATGQLKVVDIATPVHTTVRIVKKAQEFGLYCNFEKEFAKLLFRNNIKYFSDGYYRHYLKNRDILDKYFYLNSVVPKTDWEECEIKFKQDILYTLEVKEEFFEDFKIFYDAVGTYSSESIIKTAEMFYGNNEEKREFIKKQFKDIKDVAWHFMSKFYFKGCSVENFRSILKILKQHPRLTTVYYSSSSAYKGLIEFHNNLMTLSREKGEMVFGILENTTKNISYEYNELKNLIEDEINETSGELIESSVRDFKFSHWEFRELTTRLALILEGSKNAHCVGGYSSPVKNGTSKIISLTTSNPLEHDYTIELRHFRENKYYIAQCMAKYNKPASENLVNAFAREIKKNTNLEIFTRAEVEELWKKQNSENHQPVPEIEDDMEIPF